MSEVAGHSVYRILCYAIDGVNSEELRCQEVPM
jgi:hypothetical protein